MNNPYWILATICLAIFLDIALMWWLRKYIARGKKIDSGGYKPVYFLKAYSPLLTWLKGRLGGHRIQPVEKISQITELSSIDPNIPSPAANDKPKQDRNFLRLPNWRQAIRIPQKGGGAPRRPEAAWLPGWHRASRIAPRRPEAAWLSDTPNMRMTLLEILIIGVGVLFFCGGILDLGTTRQLPGNEAQLFQAVDWILRDSLLRYHSFPMWNPYIHTGLPYLGDPMLHIYNPVISVPVLVFGVNDGFKLALFFSYLLAGLGMWRLGGVLGIGRPIRVWMALMFTFAGQPVARFFQGEYLLIFGFAWIPWILVNLIRLCETRRKLYLALSALSLAMLYFCGNAYYTFLIFFGILIFALVTVFKLNLKSPWIQPGGVVPPVRNAAGLSRTYVRGMRPAVQPGGVVPPVRNAAGMRPAVQPDASLVRVYALTGLLALGLVALQLLPSIEFWPRMNKGLDVQGSHTLWQIFLDYTSKDTLRPDAYNQLPAREEYYAYIGYAPFLALVGLPFAFQKRTRKYLLFFGLLLLFSLIWIDLDRMPWRDFYYQTKWLSQFRHVLRALIFGGLALIGLAGMSLDALLKWLYQLNRTDHPGRWQKSLNLLSTGGLGALVIFMVIGVADVFLTNSQYVSTQEDYPPIYHVMQWLRQTDEGEFYVRNNPNNGWLMAVLTSNLRFIDAWYHWNDIRNFDNQLNVRAVNARPNYVVQVDAENPPLESDASVIQQLEGYTIYRLPHSLPFAFSAPLSTLLDESNADELRSEEVTAWKPFISSPQDLEIIAQGEASDVLIVLVTHYPGWRATIDGRPARLEKAGGYLAVRMVPGVHKYTFSFRPISFYIGLVISLLCISIALIWVIRDSVAERQALGEAMQRVRQDLGRIKRLPVQWFRQKQYLISGVHRNGVLIPDQPLSLAENEPVQLIVEAGGVGLPVGKLAFRHWLLASGFLVRSIVASISLEGYFFAIALVTYLLTRLLWLADFPIYFFSDEAVQTVSAIDLVHNHFFSSEHIFLPTYFKNGTFYNLSLSVYLQVIPYLLFGQSVYLTRLVSVLVSLAAAISVGLILKNNFNIRYWWVGTLLLSITPAWFLHSRTAFETVIFVSCYAGFMYLYLQYRQKSPVYLYPCLVMAALSFYAYSPGQLVIAVTGVALFFSDLRYHWLQRKWLVGGIILLAILAIPYLRFIQQQSDAPFTHLRNLDSYWTQPIPLGIKVNRYIHEYLYGLNPLYWFFPNEHDLQRHLMKGYGHLFWWTLPFALVGLWVALKNLRYSQYRVLLVSCLASPTGSALVGIGITRVLVFVIPATLLTTVGLAHSLNWVGNFSHKQQISQRLSMKIKLRLPKSPPKGTHLALMLLLLIVNFAMLRTAVIDAPTWYKDYGLYGTQYGARQIFEALVPRLLNSGDQKVFISSVWANGADIFPRFFLTPEQQSRVSMGSIDTYLSHKVDFDASMRFILTSEEYEQVLKSGKMRVLGIENIIPFPDGRPGFYTLRLAYADNVDEIFRAEAEERKKPQVSTLWVWGQEVKILYSQIDAGEIKDIFDGDFYTLIRGIEANPFVLDMEFSQPLTVSGLKAAFGSMDFRITAYLYQQGTQKPVELSETFRNMPNDPQVEIHFDQQYTFVNRMRIEILDLNESENAKIHIREVKSIP